MTTDLKQLTCDLALLGSKLVGWRLRQQKETMFIKLNRAVAYKYLATGEELPIVKSEIMILNVSEISTICTGKDVHVHSENSPLQPTSIVNMRNGDTYKVIASVENIVGADKPRGC